MMNATAFRVLGVLIFSLVYHGWPVPPNGIGVATVEPYSRLTKSDRSVLAEARANGMQDIVVVVASVRYRNADVAAAIQAAGGHVRYRADEVDYLSAVVPLAHVDTIARAPGVESINIDASLFRLLSAAADERPLARAHRTGVASSGVKPYLPVNELGVGEFLQAHPTFDGRGVTIGIVDDGIDLLTPELQTAIALDGTQAKKMRDWVIATDPLNDDLPLTRPMVGYANDCRWVSMKHHVESSSSTILYGNDVLTLPAPGRYQLGFFNERHPSCTNRWLSGDVNRDGNPEGSSGLFGVLWDEETNRVWVDVDQNHSFADEQAMIDYRVTQDVGLFGVENAGTSVRDTLPFVIQTDRTSKSVAIGIVLGIHGTMAAGAAAARSVPSGAFDGVAPGAALVSISIGNNYYLHTITEAMITAFRHPFVDIVQFAAGAAPALNDGSLVLDRVVDRLVVKYGKPIFVSASNSGPSLNSVRSPSLATNTFSVGAYISRTSWLGNFGASVTHDDYVATFSARGPREDGALKPDFIAPGSGLSAQPGIVDGWTMTGHYPLPPGYWVTYGTSLAAPMAAGTAALIMSAAKQSNTPWDLHRLRLALSAGTRSIQGYSTHEQGSGLLQVGPAWDAFRRFSQAPPVSIVSRGPVRTVLADHLSPPHSGPGTYEREGWTPGGRRHIRVTLTRESGPEGPMQYGLRWVGNDGTFDTTPFVTLPLRAPVDLDIRAEPVAKGVHSALLEIVDQDLRLALHRVPLTIVVPEIFHRDRGFSISVTGTVRRPGAASHFLKVSPDAHVLDVSVRVRRGTVAVRVYDPTGRDALGASRATGYHRQDWHQAFESPQPGVWEVVIEDERDLNVLDRVSPSPFPQDAYDLDARLLGASLELAERITAESRLASFDGRVTGSSLGTMFNDRITLGPDADQQVYDINVPPGAESLIAEVESADHRQGDVDVDLYLFNCTNGSCQLQVYGDSDTSRETLHVHDPAPGAWRAVLDLRRRESQRINLSFREVLLHSACGELTVSDTNSFRTHGRRWRASWKTQRAASDLCAARTGVGVVSVTAEGVHEARSRLRRAGSFRALSDEYEITHWPVPLARVFVLTESSSRVEASR